MNTRARVNFILNRLGLATPERVETVLALLDHETPSPFRTLAKRGLPFGAGAGTRQILDYIAPKLGKTRMDRELRDYIMLPLREVGILSKGWVDPKSGEIVPDYWKSKSPNNVYRLTDDFADLISLPDNEFEPAMEAWESETEERTTRMMSAEAAALAERDDQRLVNITVDLYCPNFLPDYEIVFIDDRDGERIGPEYVEAVERLNLPLDLASRWPDIILNVPGTNHCWIVDCVETDGEVDAVRRAEMEESFEDRGLSVDGFTTIYRTTRRFAERQSQMDNIAVGSYVWIAEIGGTQYLKKTVAHLPEVE
jgi:hypothetical protein